MRARTWAVWDLRYGLGAPTAQVYAAWARKNAAEVLTDEFPERRKIAPGWPEREDRVILYLHGRQNFLSLAGGCMLIRRVDYSLAPECPSPTQLRQAIAAVQHLLDKGLSPSNIIVAGDSAGGNLVLQLASQLLHPHPSLPTLRPHHRAPAARAPPPPPPPPPNPNPRGPSSVGGALLISPWVEFGTDAPSYARNATRDIVLPAVRGHRSSGHRARAASSPRGRGSRRAGGGPLLNPYSHACSSPRANMRRSSIRSTRLRQRSPRWCGTRRCLSRLEACMRILYRPLRPAKVGGGGGVTISLSCRGRQKLFSCEHAGFGRFTWTRQMAFASWNKRLVFQPNQSDALSECERLAAACGNHVAELLGRTASSQPSHPRLGLSFYKFTP
ncbi:Alpha/Beta hydrolase protein [Russula compacta]|nr:Alpha/Beta hydrolase protein [Russula compacta]